ncbi:FAD-binding protein, partial [Staphylococcus aureus]|uniref:FAD-binding protein n=1 Tax=Staphylococcus aureus TaxID=1280 RepID=UPI001F503BC4
MSQIHAYLDGTNWTFAIYGGTQWVTVGGAVASDIHGKNDVHQGSFGNQIQSITLITPDGHERECSQQIEPDLFRATIGGMGLTGLIKKVTLKLRQGLSRTVQFRSRPVFSLDDAVHYFN